MALNTKQSLDLVKALIDVVEKDLLDPATGHWYPADPARDVRAAADVEQVLKNAGIMVPPEVDKFITLAKAVIDLFGIK